MRAVLVALCRMLLRIFFRSIEVVGEHRLPEHGRVVFVLNHPSGLVDPLFILCYSKWKVSFLAKEPLFHMPLIGTFVRAFECLPVYRTTDGADPRKNRKMMEEAVDLLSCGNALALFPEGTSHSDPELKPFKTGAARIALSAAAVSTETIWLVPAALYYEEKDVFRSRAVLAFGEPVPTPQLALDETAQPPRNATIALTTDLEMALKRIMPTAETAAGLVLAEYAERVLSAAAREEGAVNGRVSLAVRMSTRRRLLDAYQELSQAQPERVAALLVRLETLRSRFAEEDLPVDAGVGLPAPRRRKGALLSALTLLLAPVGILGTLLHFPTYLLIRRLAFHYAGDSTDVLATAKLVGGLTLYPLTWIVAAMAAALSLGDARFFLLCLLGPLIAWLTLRFHEVLGSAVRLKRRRLAMGHTLTQPGLLSERAAVAAEILDLLADSHAVPVAGG